MQPPRVQEEISETENKVEDMLAKLQPVMGT